MKILFGTALAVLMLCTSAQASITGLASYYKMGKRTANGERYNPYGLTAAHRRFAFGTKLKVTNLSNHLFVIVRVNDRGPFVRGRVLDVSYGAAKELGMVGRGVARISFDVVN
ncbi:MAG: septal ring lytic transglycosylase RlpA family protein [Aestuariivirga sp.]